MRLRERAGHDHVGELGQQVGDRVAETWVEELAVGLVDAHDDVVRDLAQQGSQLGRGRRHAGRVVGRRQEHQLGSIGDGGGESVDVEPEIGGERHLHADTVHQAREHRVHLERAPREHDLVTGIDVAEIQLLQDARRPVADGDLLDRNSEPGGERLPDGGRPMVGIPVDPGRRLVDGGDDRVEWRLRVLVRGELDRSGDAVLGLGLGGALAGTVGREVGDDGARSTDRWFSHESDGSGRCGGHVGPAYNTPSRSSSSSSAALYPTSASTSRLCSPCSGAGRRTTSTLADAPVSGGVTR